MCELTCALAVSRPKISRHLAALRQCGLLQDRCQGQWVHYSLPGSLPEWVMQVLQSTLQVNVAWLDANQRQLNAMGDRPLRQSACC